MRSRTMVELGSIRDELYYLQKNQRDHLMEIVGNSSLSIKAVDMIEYNNRLEELLNKLTRLEIRLLRDELDSKE